MSTHDLFTDDDRTPAPSLEGRPLADRMRPATLAEVVGQDHLLGAEGTLRRALEAGRPYSIILWGPPGTGKTTLGRLIADKTGAHFLPISAVLAGVKEIREAIARARDLRRAKEVATVLFVDEVHRFNKAQQDAFLPHVEDGTVVFVGATTENPSFEVNSALLSRARVYVLKALGAAEIERLLERAVTDPERGLGRLGLALDAAAAGLLARAADGDARRALNGLELCAEVARAEGADRIDEALAGRVLGDGTRRRFDKGGDAFYDQISALHKSIRGSDPDASLYWLARMLDGGCDPHYIARRLVRVASEDVGNADPRALALALDAWDAYSRLGSPEGELAIGQAVVYLACAPKSNAVDLAFAAARADVEGLGSLEVPVHLRNAPTRLMRELGHGRDYRFPHDEPEGYAPGERYFPDAMPPRRYYSPPARGLEVRIIERLERLRALDEAARREGPAPKPGEPANDDEPAR